MCVFIHGVVCLLQKRHLLEDSNQLDARRSALDDDLEEMEEDEEEGEFKVNRDISYHQHGLDRITCTQCIDVS